MAFDAKTTAICFIEYQNDFTSTGGILHAAVQGVMQSTSMLDNSEKLLTAARKGGPLILHVPISFDDQHSEIRGDYGILASVKTNKAFIKSQWGGQICDAMKPSASPREITVEGKKGLCAFASTNLNFLLGQHSIKTLVLTGFLTNCCVESTMRQAYELGFEVVTLIDCMAATSEEAHKAAIEYTFPMFSKPMSSGDFLKALV